MSPPLFLAHSSPNLAKAEHQPLDNHLYNVAQLAAKFASSFNASELAFAAGLLHDLGKYSTAFQQRLMGAAIKVNHSSHGGKIALECYGKAGYLLAYAIAGHHAGLANGMGEDGVRTSLFNRLNDNTLPILENAWKKELTLPSRDDLFHVIKLFTANENYKNFHCQFLVRMLFSTLVDADYLDTEKYYAQFENLNQHRAAARLQTPPTLETLREQLNHYLQGFSVGSNPNDINLIRADILKYARAQATKKPGIFSLNVPTGGGKTLASLAFALDHAIANGQRRIILVIPFTSIVEQNARVFRAALGKYGESAVSEHHSGFMAAESGKSAPDYYQSQTKLRLAMENWDAPIIVTTAVQFFESLFASKPSQCRKLHNISNSVIIVDEAQTIPFKVLRPCVAALEELARNYKNTVVLCTATQPALEAPQFKGGFQHVNKLVKDEEKLAKQLERVRIAQLGAIDDSTLTEHIRSREQVLCIVNNRLHARAVYQSIANLPGSVHLSTLMCAKHRSATLANVRERLAAKKPCRVISTSLIEAGVDVSFPTVMRAATGLDSIAQAAGRCNRNKEWLINESTVFTFSSTNKEWCPPKELEQLASAAQEVLRQYPDAPFSPSAIRAYFEKVYWKKGMDALDSKDLLGSIQKARLDSLPMEDLDKKFQMIESNQQAIIIGWDAAAKAAIEDLRHKDKIGPLARQLQPYLVQVPHKAFIDLREAGAIQPIAPEKWGNQFMELINTDLYSDAFGLSWDCPSFIEANKLNW